MSAPQFDKTTNTGLRHLVNATRFSIHGLRSAYLHESAFRQELLLLLLLIPSAVWFAASAAQIAALICAGLLLLAIELLNSGIEAAIDRVGLEHHEMAKLAKDYGSAAVMMGLMIVATVWFFIAYTAYTS